MDNGEVWPNHCAWCDDVIPANKTYCDICQEKITQLEYDNAMKKEGSD